MPDITTKWKAVRIALTTLYLMLGWLLFTWTLAVPSLVIGLVFSTSVAMVTFGVFIEKDEAARRSLLPRAHFLIIFLCVLVIKIYLASFKLVPMVITLDVSPRIVHFRSKLKSNIARVALANAITLTPGTLTLDLSSDHLIVHWLDAPTTHSKYAHSLIAESFERWLKRIWM